MPHVVGADAHVAVREDQHVMRGGGQHVDEVRDLAVRPVQPGVGDDRHVRAGKRGAQRVDGAQRGIVAIVHAEQELDRPVVALLAKAREVREQRPLDAVQRLDDRDGRARVRLAWRTREKRCVSAAATSVYTQPNAAASAHGAASNAASSVTKRPMSPNEISSAASSARTAPVSHASAFIARPSTDTTAHGRPPRDRSGDRGVVLRNRDRTS